MPARSSHLLRALARRGSSTLENKRASRVAFVVGSAEDPAAWAPWAFISLSESQGVTVKAIASEIAMPRLELIGIGLM